LPAEATVAPLDLQYSLSRLTAIAALEMRWRDLEERSDPSFFQSWGWLGTWLSLLPADSETHIFEARLAAQPVCLAILVKKRRRFYVAETGNPELDALTIEYNGLLIDRRLVHLLTEVFLPKLLSLLPSGTELVVSGVPESYRVARLPKGFALQIADAKTSYRMEFVGSRDPIGSISKSTQYKLRRARRRYAALGAVVLRVARDTAEAHLFLEELVRLHQRYWRARGMPGAFANPSFSRFHHRLIDRCFRADEIRLTQLVAGTRAIGYLYNFRYRRRVYAYQSGFDYECIPGERPGLLSHWEAMCCSREDGTSTYDFLAGSNQMKECLSNRTEPLFWLIFRRKTLSHAVEAAFSRGKQAVGRALAWTPQLRSSRRRA